MRCSRQTLNLPTISVTRSMKKLPREPIMSSSMGLVRHSRMITSVEWVEECGYHYQHEKQSDIGNGCCSVHTVALIMEMNKSPMEASTYRASCHLERKMRIGSGLRVTSSCLLSMRVQHTSRTVPDQANAFLPQLRQNDLKKVSALVISNADSPLKSTECSKHSKRSTTD